MITIKNVNNERDFQIMCDIEIMNIIKNGRLHKDEPHSADIWRKHGEHDSYMSIREIRIHAAQHIPYAKVQRKLFWRYFLIWEKK